MSVRQAGVPTFFIQCLCTCFSKQRDSLIYFVIHRHHLTLIPSLMPQSPRIGHTRRFSMLFTSPNYQQEFWSYTIITGAIYFISKFSKFHTQAYSFSIFSWRPSINMPNMRLYPRSLDIRSATQELVGCIKYRVPPYRRNQQAWFARSLRAKSGSRQRMNKLGSLRT